MEQEHPSDLIIGGAKNIMVALDLKIIVAGGGIGGMVTAIACKEKGFDVIVLESQAEFLHVSV